MSTKKTPPLQIIRLSISHFGIIEAASILPDGNPVLIAGNNGAGKSTILNSIESVLYGRKLAEPITHGQDKAEIKLELAEAGQTSPVYRLEQIIKNDKDGNPCYNLKIYDAEKKQVPTPASFIQTLIGSGAALDPTEIMQARPGERPETFAKRQAETLMERLGLSRKAKAMDEQIETLTDTRKRAKADADALRSRLDAFAVPPGTPDEPVDVSTLAAKQSELAGTKAARQRLEDKIASKREAADGAAHRVSELQRLLSDAQKTHAGAMQIYDAAVLEVETFDENNPPEGVQSRLESIQKELSNATATNAAVAAKTQRKAVSTELTQAESRANAADSELGKIKEARLDLVRSAKLPVKGLELTAEALLYNGKPLIQESTGNQIRVCAQLAMAEEPQCRVLFLREGSLMNTANKKVILDVANERGWSVWEERFSETPVDGALWVQDGEVYEKAPK